MTQSSLNRLLLNTTLGMISFLFTYFVHLPSAQGHFSPQATAVKYPSHKSSNKSIKDIQTAIGALSANESFAFYDLPLSPDELGILQKIAIQNPENYEYFGTLPIPHKELIVYLKRIGPNKGKAAGSAAKIIAKIVSHLLQASDKKAAWVCLRATTPNKEFDIPRWHIDGYYYQPSANQYKFSISLKGPPTLFYQLPPTLRKQFNELRKGDVAYQMSMDTRQKIADLLNDPTKRLQAQPNQGGVFVVGADNAGVHSEPPMPEKRLFLSVLPGSELQIKEWAAQE